MRRRLRLPTTARRADAGFTLVELLVAMVITMIVMTAFVGVFVGSLRTVAQAKQRQQASALATRAMEQLRALPYAVLTSGLSLSDLAGDANVQGSPPTFRPAALPAVDEPLVASSSTAQPAPLRPHISPTTVGGVTYDVSSYVTQKLPVDPATQAYNLTVVVTWTSNVSNGARTVTQRSTAYSPSGCLSTTTHPFSGPCQAAFSAQAGRTSAQVVVTNADDPSQPVVGFGMTKAELDLPTFGSTLLLEQTTNVSSTVGTSAGLVGSAVMSKSGGAASTSAADLDPTTAPPPVQAGSVSQSGSPSGGAALGSSGVLGSFNVVPAAADTGSTYAAVAAGSTGCADADGGGTSFSTTGRPCATSVVNAAVSPGQQTPGISANVVGLPASMSIVTYVPGSFPSRATAAQLVAPTSSACKTGTGAAGDGCSHARASRLVAAMQLGGLPAGGMFADGTTSVPANFYLFSLANLAESALAESGVGAASPSYSRTGQLTYWDPATSSFSQLTMDATTAQTLAIAPTTASYGDTIVTVEGTLALIPASDIPPPCAAAVACAQAGKSADIRAVVTYTVSQGGITSRFAVTSDLGGLLAQTSYQAAPNA